MKIGKHEEYGGPGIFPTPRPTIEPGDIHGTAGEFLRELPYGSIISGIPDNDYRYLYIYDPELLVEGRDVLHYVKVRERDGNDGWKEIRVRPSS